MRTKVIASAVIVAAGVLLFVGMREVNKADAAGSDCYSAPQGPSTPTLCN